jgi:hypothetical protein
VLREDVCVTGTSLIEDLLSTRQKAPKASQLTSTYYSSLFAETENDSQASVV